MSRLHYLIFGVVGITVLVIALAVLGVGRKPPRPPAAELEFWGMQDEEGMWQSMISAFREQYPHITVTYRRLNESTYEDTVVNRLAAGVGPDIFMLKNSWILKHWWKVTPLPPEFGLTPRQLPNVFADGVADELVSPNQQIIGLPLFYDTLALFYNKDIFNAAGIAEPPKTWEEVAAISAQLTKATPARDIIKSGIALGAYENVEHAWEIMSALMFQYGDMVAEYRKGTPNLGNGAGQALAFYTSFADQTHVRFSWTPRMKNSLDAFAEGTAAMVIGTSADIKRLQGKNPHLRFGITSLPQRKGASVPVTYGTHFFPTVSRLSQKKIPAWQFIMFAASSEGASIYLKKTQRPPARRDLISGEPLAGLESFWKQGLVAKSWAVPDEQAVQALFKEAVEAVLLRREAVGSAISRLRSRLEVLMP